MTNVNAIDFYLHVCTSDNTGCCSPGGSSSSSSVQLFGSAYPIDYRGKIEVASQVVDNNLSFTVPEFNVTPRLGDADEIKAVTIRVCDKDLSVQAVYSTPEKTALSACCHGGGCRCYASACAC